MDYTDNNERDIQNADSLDVEDVIKSFSDDEKTGENEILEAPAKKNKKNQPPKGILSYLHDLVFGLVIILLLMMLVFRIVIVSGPSMNQTLQNGDCIIMLSNILYREPKYGDIIVASKDSYKNGEPIIKRVIATEGQEVDIDFVKGIVYVDGVALEESYTNTPTNLFEGITFPQIVPEGCIFVMGDNRNDSKDSRSTEIGMVECREILGKALLIVFPGKDTFSGERDFDRIGAIG